MVQNAELMDGTALAAAVRRRVAERTEVFRKRTGQTPGLAVCLVGDDPASHVYVRKKGEACREVGFHSVEHRLPASATTTEVIRLVQTLNLDPKIHGILVQMPLPKGCQTDPVLEAVDPRKDVDGFHPENVGLLHLGRPRFVPCTPQGVMHLLEEYKVPLVGKHAVVLGRSTIVGKPMAHLLLQANATVTICHSRTENLPEVIRQADVLVAAIGRPRMIKGEWIRPGAAVLDVGINRDSETKKLVGDVDVPSARERARWITPVPGGVGPMTIACLLENTLAAAERTLS